MYQLVQSPFGYTLRMIRDNPRRAAFLGIQVWRIRLLAFVVAGVFGGIGGLLMSLFVSSAYPDFAYWTISGEGVFMILLGGMNAFLGPLAGAVLLLLLSDTVTRFTEHFGLVLGIVILFFALGMRKGVLGFALDAWRKRAATLRAGRRGRSGKELTMLSVENLRKSFGGVGAMNGVSLHFGEGSLSAIIGPNGAGKTTLFNLITGAFAPDAGNIMLGSEDIAGLPAPEIVRRGIGRAFQIASIFPTLTVRETILGAVNAHRRWHARLGRRFPLAEAQPQADEVMELVKLSSRAEHAVGEPVRMAIRSCSISHSRLRWSRACCCSTNRPQAWAPRSAGK